MKFFILFKKIILLREILMSHKANFEEIRRETPEKIFRQYETFKAGNFGRHFKSYKKFYKIIIRTF